nr:Chain C, NQK-OC43 peptide [Human coronavirus 229E]
NQKLIANAF